MLVYFPLLLLSSPSFTSPPPPPPPAAAFYESNYQHTQIYYSSMYCSFDTLLEICMLTSKATRRWHASMRLLLPLSSITTPPTHHTPTHISPSLHTPALISTLVSQGGKIVNKKVSQLGLGVFVSSPHSRVITLALHSKSLTCKHTSPSHTCISQV